MLTAIRRNLFAALGWIALLCCGASALSAQTADAGVTTLQLSTRLVVLDVVVTDSKGNVVPGLRRDDFTLFQDGKPQTIRSFEGWTGKAQQAETPSTAQSSHQGTVAEFGGSPLTLFVLDDLNTPFEEKSYAAETLKRYLKAQPARLNSPSALMVVNDGGLHALVAYTRDRDAVLHALATRPAAVPDQLAKGQTLELLTESFAVLRQIALASESSRAHKNLVWLGRGFPALDRTQLDDANNAELDAGIRNVVTLLTDARITVYKVDPITADARAGTDIAAAMDAGATLGTAGLNATAEDPLDGSFNFNSFAVDTGGAYFYGSNDLDRLIGESLQRGSEFYTLSFAPAQGVGFQAVRVVMRNPALHATTRNGFYDAVAPHDAVIAPAGVDLQLAATSPMSYTAVAAHIDQVKLDPVASRLRVDFHVDDRTLTWTDAAANSRATSKMRILLVALDGQRQIQHTSLATLNLAVDSRASIEKGVVTTMAEVAIDRRTRFIRLLVQDASGRLGAADVDPATMQTIQKR